MRMPLLLTLEAFFAAFCLGIGLGMLPFSLVKRKTHIEITVNLYRVFLAFGIILTLTGCIMFWG